MLSAANALPAGPEERDDDVFPIRERIRLRDNFGLALLELRARNAEFQRLSKGPWALFIGIAVHWQGNAEAWPSQDTLSRFSGWSTRAVRDQADSLERAGFICRRERMAAGRGGRRTKRGRPSQSLRGQGRAWPSSRDAEDSRRRASAIGRSGSA